MKKVMTTLLVASLLALQLAACTPPSEPSVTPESNPDTPSVSESGSIEDATSSPETDPDTDPEIETDAPLHYDDIDLSLVPESPVEGEGMTIGGTDISAFSIVRSADMPEGQIAALEMFAEQLRAITGAALPIITDDGAAEHEIVVGLTNRSNSALAQAVSEIKDDGYAVVVDGGDLYVSATTGRGVVYGMCDFLENYMGVRLYATDYIYRRNVGAIALQEGMKIVFSPEFHARRTWIDDLTGTPLNDVIFSKNNSDGLKKAKVGDSVVVRANSNHTIDTLADMKGASPCPTDEKVYQTVLKNVVEKLENNLLQNTIQVGQVDGSEPCRCDRCKAACEPYGTENAAWFLFINRLADEVAGKYPERDVKIITYSYQFTHGVPGNGFTVSDHVIINFCFDDACYNHAFNDPQCKKNRPVAAELRQWAALCKAENLYVYEYAYNCGDAPLPDPNVLVMWDNFNFYLECGVNGILSEGIQCKGGDFDHLRAYLRSKLVWNPHITQEEYFTILKQFMVDYYGDAAPLMIEYLQIISDRERISCTDMYTPMYTFYRMGDEEKDTDVSQELLLRCQAIFDEALALETLTEEQKAHVEYTAIHLFLVRWHNYPKDAEIGKGTYYKTIYAYRQKFGL